MATTASVTSAGSGLRQEIRINDRHTLVVDEPACLGGTDSAPAPTDLLAAALAGCVMVTLRMYADRKGFALDGVTVDVELDRDAKPPRATVTTRLPDGLDDAVIARLEHVSHACPVSRLLEHGMSVEHRLLVGAQA